MQDRRNSPVNGFFFVFSLIMISIYVMLGIALLFSSYFDVLISGMSKIILGVILLIYGGFRVYFLYQKRKYEQ